MYAVVSGALHFVCGKIERIGRYGRHWRSKEVVTNDDDEKRNAERGGGEEGARERERDEMRVSHKEGRKEQDSVWVGRATYRRIKWKGRGG